MSIVRMRINKYLQPGDGPPPRVYARITRMDDRGRSVPASLRHELVPISMQERDSVAISLDSGAYAVEVRLPTGELLADSVRVIEGEEQELVLTAEDSSHEWLSWQHLAGNAPTRNRSAASRPPPRDDTQAEAAGAAPSASAKSRPRSRNLPEGPFAAAGLEAATARVARDLLESIGLRIVDGLVRPADSESVPATWAPDAPAQVDPGRAIHWLGSDVIESEQEFLRRQPWQALSALKGSTDNILAGLKGGGSDRTINASMKDDVAAVFPIPNEARRNSTTREFAAVRRRMGVELVCLPTPWRDSWTQRDAVIEVGVQIPRYEYEFASSVIVRDQQLAVLLGFLSTGALSAVNRLAQVSDVMMQDKNDNPLAAAAGGYALVGSVVDTKPHSWHGWVENLMRSFEHVPDGAIQYGTLRLRLRTGTDDVREATRAFKEAYRRGLPYYGMGMRWLLDGLERISAEDPEAQEMATAVRRVASRLHSQSPFTILRLGKR